jgi:hypothetical protein
MALHEPIPENRQGKISDRGIPLGIGFMLGELIIHPWKCHKLTKCTRVFEMVLTCKSETK